ncbi:aconitate hydratase AcnA [Sphingomonas sp. AR_OL41]|uniref:aconitate hydratase AcnA n=1 Tax=Sphingomonas sp. AR_OL41 TaxID=3042729 RepID=UPI002480A0E6|nr:aconitate hydratase AcnA [Sphingomonas sp. AR_OL41]MDH7973637.1 aconitate hydratase AcnA [Sphingomonas sp. AR_OL41]
MLGRIAPGRRERLARLPRSLVILLENVLAYELEPVAYVEQFEAWLDRGEVDAELPFRPARILMQDTAGVAALADLAALRDFAAHNGRRPEAVDAAIPIDLVIDHSLKVDHSGTGDAAALNLALEYGRNDERYRFFKWAEQAFGRLTIVPPGQGICHQINLEQLTSGIVPAPGRTGLVMAETLIGTDSHTTMVNALGVLGWGVGGIEAELAALGASMPIALPRVSAVRLQGRRRPGVTATDIALAITLYLRSAGVVDEIVEFVGAGLDDLTLPDRAAISNMCPEYGATAALFPVDEVTLDYLTEMGRTFEGVASYRRYAVLSGLWRDAGAERKYSRMLDFALDAVEPVMAGPSRPDQLRTLGMVAASLRESFPGARPSRSRAVPSDGAIAIAAITSCTNTANPGLMVAAGLLARNAVRHGLQVPTWVKTSLAPGSRRIADLLERAGLQLSLDELGFNVIGFGCTTCVGNSGDLKVEISGAHKARPNLLVGVLSGNRNFEGRIHPAVQANYLASPPLVVAAALAGNLFVDIASEPLGFGPDGAPVGLEKIWPSDAEIAEVLAALGERSRAVVAGDRVWSGLDAQCAEQFSWDEASTFIRQPPFFVRPAQRLEGDIEDARPLLVLGDNVTTDHISPIGRIQPGSPAAQFLSAKGEAEVDFGGYGDRRANHDVMTRGTFDSARLENRLVGRPGNYTLGPDGLEASVFDAAQAFAARQIPVVVFAGRQYGTGSARDWAAKGTALLGIRAVIAQSFERIHRANLIALGVLPIVIEEDVAMPRALERICVRGIDSLSAERQELVVEILREGSDAPERHAARADVRSRGQLDLLRSGGLFATLGQRYKA